MQHSVQSPTQVLGLPKSVLKSLPEGNCLRRLLVSRCTFLLARKKKNKTQGMVAFMCDFPSDSAKPTQVPGWLQEYPQLPSVCL